MDACDRGCIEHRPRSDWDLYEEPRPSLTIRRHITKSETETTIAGTCVRIYGYMECQSVMHQMPPRKAYEEVLHGQQELGPVRTPRGTWCPETISNHDNHHCHDIAGTQGSAQCTQQGAHLCHTAFCHEIRAKIINIL